jgi:hypothetical protein
MHEKKETFKNLARNTMLICILVRKHIPYHVPINR